MVVMCYVKKPVKTIEFKPSFWARIGVLIGKPIKINFEEGVYYSYGDKNTLNISLCKHDANEVDNDGM